MSIKKQSKSYSMSQDMIEYIQEYKKNNNLSNDSIALERILLDHKYNVCSNRNTEDVKAASTKVENDDKEDIKNSINNIFDSMPD